MSSQLPELSQAPQPDLALSRKQRIAKGIGVDYVDAYNQVASSQYNNAYNYWLWQQQAEYNSPSNQVARLKAAGLNPNFNSIDGTGNLSSLPSSSMSITPSIARNTSYRTQNILNTVNTAVDTFAKGLQGVSELSDLPPLDKIGDYRKLLYRTAQENLKGKERDNFQKMIDNISDVFLAGGNMNGFDEYGNPKPFEIPSPYATASTYGDASRTPAATGNIVIDPLDNTSLQKAQKQLRALGIDIDIKDAIRYVKEQSKDYDVSAAKGKSGISQAYQVVSDIANGEAFTFREFLAAMIVLGLSRL